MHCCNWLPWVTPCIVPFTWNKLSFFSFVGLRGEGGVGECVAVSTNHLTCTLYHRCHRYSTNYYRMQPHRSCSVVMSYWVQPSIGQHEDHISPLKPDNWLNRNRQAHKCNYPQRPGDSTGVASTSLDMNTKHHTVCHSIRNCSNNLHHHNHHQHKLNHRTSKFPGMSVSFPLGLCIAKCLSLDYSIRPLINP